MQCICAEVYAISGILVKHFAGAVFDGTCRYPDVPELGPESGASLVAVDLPLFAAARTKQLN